MTRVKRSSFATLILLLLLLPANPVAGCVAQAPPHIDWAVPVTGGGNAAASEAQELMNSYAQALVEKDRGKVLSTLDAANPGFSGRQQEIFDRLAAVPFADYRIDITSQTETAPGTLTAKVTIASTLKESFSELPEPERAAFSLVRREDGWKLSGDVTAEALGRKRGAQLEDFGPVEVLTGEHAIILYHPGHRRSAESVQRNIDAAFPRLVAALPGVSLPKVPVRIFDDVDQINQAFPGQWQEWTGGASRRLGGTENQGGEIIIGASQYNEMEASDYNSNMLAHELTHIALFPKTGIKTPPFLEEGLADFVAGPEPVVLLKEKMRRGEAFSPTMRDLSRPGSYGGALLTDEAAALAYEQADTAVSYLENRYGNESVLALLREFKRREEDQINQEQLVDEVFKAVLGAGWADFEKDWRRWVVEG